MEKFITRTEKIPFYSHYEIIVAGGGVAGAAAALAAAREGKKVLLIEKSCILGGLATIGLVNYFVPMCNGRGKKIISGMAEEFLNLSIRYGYDTLPDDWKNGEPEAPTNARYVTRFSPWIFALALTELLHSTGVEILFDTVVTDVIMEKGRCEGLLIQNKSGRSFCTASAYIDATGDADILFRAGVPTVQGKNYFTYQGFSVTVDSCRKVAETGNFAFLNARLVHGGCINLYGHKQPENVPLYKGTEGDDVSDYLIRNQLLMFENLKKQPEKSVDLLSIPIMPQFRTTRRINGDVTLKENDAYRHFADSVGAICDFERRDFLYEIPYGTMVRKGFPNLITAGRSVSGDGYAWDILRVIPPAIVSGQAAGLAAAQSVDSGTALDSLELEPLQRAMAKGGNQIHFDDALVPAGSAVKADTFADIGHI
ncbi:MAG: FAD-dependent oxidoreductase [Lentisphaeria bacterium]|nr:FAD-dependent oxidoreductase [Lentisphaeria bacterium]